MTILVSASGARAQPILFVNGSVVGGVQDGSSWTNAYTELRDALDAASTNPAVTQIWVAAGRYTPAADDPDATAGTSPGDHANRSFSFRLRNDLAIYGGFAGTETNLNARNPFVNITILSGDLKGNDVGDLSDETRRENSVHVVTAEGVGPTALLDGFTIKGGRADRLPGEPSAASISQTDRQLSPEQLNALRRGVPREGLARVEAGSARGDDGSSGGGFLIIGASPSIRDCTIVGNSASAGGGVYSRDLSSPTFLHCRFVDNAAGQGGALANVGQCNPSVVDSAFVLNFALAGGAVFNEDASRPTFAHDQFVANEGLQGGAIWNTLASDAILDNCLFADNTSVLAGALGNSGSSPVVRGCTFTRNVAGVGGGGVLNQDGSSPTFTNCILWANVADGQMDAAAQISTAIGTPVVNYSCVQGGWTGAGGIGNISDDPLFVNPSEGNFTLSVGSPCIDAADNTEVPPDGFDLDGDGDTVEPVPVDLNGDPRFIDDPSTADTGVGTAPVVDMGAFEALPECVPCSNEGTCDDCNLNGFPDVCDLKVGILTDLDGDGVPDECVEPPPEGGSWSDDIWGLAGGNPFPDDNAGVPDLHVTIDAAEVFLDVTIDIPTLRLLNGATLRVTQVSPTSNGLGGTGAGAGDLTVTEPGGIFAAGNLIVDNDRRIDIPVGLLTLDEGGHYEAASASGPNASALGGGGFVTASLTADSVLLLPMTCGETQQMTLQDQMTVQTTNDFVMDGTGVVLCPFGGLLPGSVAGGQIPPILRVKSREPALGASASLGPGLEFTQVTVGGSFRMLEAAVVCIGCGAGAGDPVSRVVLHGDFDNQSRFPSLFDWTRASLQFTGASVSVFEVAGLDLGQTFEGFLTEREVPAGSGPHTNFSMGTIRVEPGHEVRFVNEHPNTIAAGACGEALYVDTLVLEEGSKITLDNVRVYYITLEDHRATIETVGPCAALLSVCVSEAPVTQFVPTNRYISFNGANAGTPSAIRVTFRNLPPPFDRRNGTTMWVGPPNDVNENGGAVAPVARGETVKVAPLQCEPFYTDWSRLGTVHAFHELVVPGGIYELTAIADRCAVSNEGNFSASSSTAESLWGDVAGRFRGGVWSPPDGSVDFAFDLVALIDKFANRPGAPSKVRADLEPATPNQVITIGDVALAVDAFRGLSYPFEPLRNPCP